MNGRSIEMKIKKSQNILPISEFRQNSTVILEEARRMGHPVTLTKRGRAIAVVEDVRAYQERLQRLELAEKVAHGLRAAEEGDFIDHEEAISHREDSCGGVDRGRACEWEQSDRRTGE